MTEIEYVYGLTGKYEGWGFLHPRDILEFPQNKRMDIILNECLTMDELIEELNNDNGCFIYSYSENSNGYILCVGDKTLEAFFRVMEPLIIGKKVIQYG